MQVRDAHRTPALQPHRQDELSVTRDDDAGPAAARDWGALAARIQAWGHELGFESVGVAGVDLGVEELRLLNWLRAGRHGEMDYMARHGAARARPAELVPGTVRVITARMNYWPAGAEPAASALGDSHRAYVSRYALGRDYHRVLRRGLARLARRIQDDVGPFGCRVFTDSAPVLEVALAARSGLGWRGKHTLLLTRDMGSYFFLGEIYTDLPLPETAPVSAHCGTCTACMTACPTGAIVAPYELDARRCISYLTEIASMAATTASSYARGTATQSPRQQRISQESATASTPRSLRRSSRGTNRPSCATPKAAQSGESASSAGRATSPSHSAMRRRHLRSSLHCEAGPTIRRRSCASTSRGRSSASAGSLQPPPRN